MVYKGEDSNVGFSFESEDTEFDTVFTPGAQTGCLGILSSAELTDSPQYVDQGSASTRDQYIATKGKINLTGNLPIDIQDGRLFYLAMGSVTDSGAVGALYGHTVTGKNTGHVPSLVMEALYSGTNNFLRIYRGVKVNTINLSGMEGDNVVASASLMACKSDTSLATPSDYDTPETNLFMFEESTLEFNSKEWNTTGFTWQVTNNMQPYWTARQYNERYAYLLQERQRAYKLGCSVILEDNSDAQDFYDFLKSGDTADAEITLRNGNKRIGIEANDCTVRNAPHLMSEVGEEVEITVEMVPKTCTVITIDQISSYTNF